MKRRASAALAIAALALCAALAQQGSSAIFARECADCHGPDGRGRMMRQPDFTDPDYQRAVSDEYLFNVIKWGRDPMPSYVGLLSDEQIRGQVEYIRSLAAGQKPRPDNCASCHGARREAAMDLFLRSTHHRAGISCSKCHGGDPLAAEKEIAHGAGFVARPDPKGALAMCGRCHTEQLSLFESSRHFSQAGPRLDCSQCHGAHGVGARGRNFSFAYFCSGCHGLEYLPALPAEFQRMLELVDRIEWAASDLGELSPDDARRKRELGRQIGRIVHATDLDGGLKKIASILELGRQLERDLEQKKRD